MLVMVSARVPVTFESAVASARSSLICFRTKNIVGRAQTGAKASFLLCSFNGMRDFTSIHEVRCEPLADAILRDDFWEFQKTQQPDAFAFISRLLPFLSSLKTGQHKHFWITGEEGIKASLILGQTKSCGFIFNGLVRKNARAQGLARELNLSARSSLGELQTFYWTKHPYLTLGADKVSAYHLL